MKFSYNKLWKLLIENSMTKKDLMQKASVSSNSISSMVKGKSVNLETLWRICKILNCNIQDIMEFIF